MPNTASINGINYTNDFCGLENITTEYILTESGYSEGKGIATLEKGEGDSAIKSEEKIRIQGKAYEYISNKLANDCYADIIIDVYLDCCGLDYQFYLDNSEFEDCCDECYADVSLIIRDPDKEAIDCLNNYIPVPSSDASQLIGTVFKWASVTQGNNETATLYTVNSYMQYYANQCGVEWCSSILQGDYQNIIIFCTQTKFDAFPGTNNLANQHILSPLEQLNCLKDVFNAEIRLNNGKLSFERKDKFYEVGEPLFDIHELYKKGCLDKAPCFTLKELESCAYARYEYKRDQGDTSLQSADYNQYNDIVEWNVGGTKKQLTGTCTTTLKFSPTSVFANNIFIEPTTDAAEECRLWHWDGVYDNTNSQLVHDDDCGYNYTLHFNENSPCTPNLYQDFHAIDKPGDVLCIWNMNDVTIAPPTGKYCEWAKIIQEKKTNIGFQTKKGIAIPDSIKIDDSTCTIEFKDIKIPVYNA